MKTKLYTSDFSRLQNHRLIWVFIIRYNYIVKYRNRRKTNSVLSNINTICLYCVKMIDNQLFNKFLLSY